MGEAFGIHRNQDNGQFGLEITQGGAMKIGFRLDAGGEIGLGHFFRCLSIAEAFTVLGNEVYFLSRNLPSWLQEIAIGHGAEIAQISSPGTSARLSGDGVSLNRLPPDDSSQTLAVSRTLGLDLLVVDHYGIDQAWFSNLERKGPRLMQIADFPVVSGGDFLLDYGFDASSAKHEISENSAQVLLLGPQFAPISLPPWESLGNQSHECGESLPEVAIALGSGVDLAFLRAIKREYLDSSRSFNLSLVTGDESSEKTKSEGVQWVASTDGLVDLFSKSNFVVTSGGVSMYERIASGVPGAVVETAINQRPALTRIKKEGLGSDAFYTLPEFHPKALMEAIDQSLSTGFDLAHRLLLQSTVDFFGPMRVAFAIGAVPPPSALVARQFEPGDSSILFRWANEKNVRANSMSSEKISPEEHLRWQENLGSKETRIWIFEYQGIPFGQVRFELEHGKVFISYSIDLLFRGLRRSFEMISSAIRQASIGEDIFARARASNLASIKTLTRLGFHVLTSRDDVLILVLPTGEDSKKGLLPN
jgi:spore coat polysaccharide biosynthesis predicted glycosyltransferase SpsG